MQCLPKHFGVLFELKYTGCSTRLLFSAVSPQTSGSEDMQIVRTSKHSAKAVFIANHDTEHELLLHSDRFSEKIRISRLKCTKPASPNISHLVCHFVNREKPQRQNLVWKSVSESARHCVQVNLPCWGAD